MASNRSLTQTWQHFRIGRRLADGTVPFIRKRDNAVTMYLQPDSEVDVDLVSVTSCTQEEKSELRYMYMFYVGTNDPFRINGRLYNEQITWIQ